MKDKRVLLAKDIQEIYTKVVNTYLEKGYTVNIGTMHGIQSDEIAKIDVTNGKDVYRIALFSGMWSVNSGEYVYCCGDKIVLSVEKFNLQTNSHLRCHDTLWNGKGKTVCSTEWYELSNRRAKAYTNNLNYACECKMLSYRRRKARGGYDYDKTTKTFNLSDKQKAIVADMCRRTRGYMRIKDSDIARLDLNTYENGRKTFRVYFLNGKDGLTIGRIRG